MKTLNDLFSLKILIGLFKMWTKPPVITLLIIILIIVFPTKGLFDYLIKLSDKITEFYKIY